MLSGRRVADERDLSDLEDDDSGNRRNQADFEEALNKRKASPAPVNGTTATTSNEKTEHESVHGSYKINNETSEETMKTATRFVEG
jgi:hypothetical protein